MAWRPPCDVVVAQGQNAGIGPVRCRLGRRTDERAAGATLDGARTCPSPKWGQRGRRQLSLGARSREAGDAGLAGHFVPRRDHHRLSSCLSMRCTRKPVALG